MKKNQIKLKTDEYSKSLLIKFIRIMKISVLLLFLGVASVFADRCPGRMLLLKEQPRVQ